MSAARPPTWSLNTAFGEPTIAVDTHIFRVSKQNAHRAGKNVVEVEQRLMRTVPEEFKRDCHHWLILHGRYTCVARSPNAASASSPTSASSQSVNDRTEEAGRPGERTAGKAE